MMYDHFNQTVEGITEKLRLDPTGTNARKKYALEIAKLGRKLYSGDTNIA